jgi:hypothetical protein
MEIFPVAARWQPPETGQSTGSAPVARTSAPRRFTSASSVVDISAQIFPAPSAERIPSSASITVAEAAGEGRQVMTSSHVAAISAGLSAHFAPLARKRRATPRSRSRTVRSWPLRSSEPASLPPTLPRPMNPIFIVVSGPCRRSPCPVQDASPPRPRAAKPSMDRAGCLSEGKTNIPGGRNGLVCEWPAACGPRGDRRWRLLRRREWQVFVRSCCADQSKPRESPTNHCASRPNRVIVRWVNENSRGFRSPVPNKGAWLDGCRSNSR